MAMVTLQETFEEAAELLKVERCNLITPEELENESAAVTVLFTEKPLDRSNAQKLGWKHPEKYRDFNKKCLAWQAD